MECTEHSLKKLSFEKSLIKDFILGFRNLGPVQTRHLSTEKDVFQTQRSKLFPYKFINLAPAILYYTMNSVKRAF